LRYVLVPGLTDAEEDLTALREFADALPNVQKIELLPYHTMGVEKYQKLGISYPLEGVEPPTTEMVARAKMLLGI
jgi:pyruvate formate lyase activating enzyme